LIPKGKIAESRIAMEEAVEYATKDMVFCARQVIRVGCDGINLDTTGGAGDHDFLAALRRQRFLREISGDVH